MGHIFPIAMLAITRWDVVYDQSPQSLCQLSLPLAYSCGVLGLDQSHHPVYRTCSLLPVSNSTDRHEIDERFCLAKSRLHHQKMMQLQLFHAISPFLARSHKITIQSPYMTERSKKIIRQDGSTSWAWQVSLTSPKGFFSACAAADPARQSTMKTCKMWKLQTYTNLSRKCNFLGSPLMIYASLSFHKSASPNFFDGSQWFISAGNPVNKKGRFIRCYLRIINSRV